MEYIEDIEVWSMQIINDSHSLVEELLLKEEAVRLRKGAPKHLGYRTRGRTLELIPTKEFALEYADSLDGMVQLRFQKSAMAIASTWYSAWIYVGSPYFNSRINSKDESSRFLQGYQLTLEEPLWGFQILHRQRQDTLQLEQDEFPPDK